MIIFTSIMIIQFTIMIVLHEHVSETIWSLAKSSILIFCKLFTLFT